jgi:hypothetical protein
MRIAYGATWEDVMLEDLINAWHDAVNRRDLPAARALVTDPVDVSGPRGTQSISAEAFTEWIVESGIRLRPVSAHPVDEHTMVVEQEATWPQTPDPSAVATLFRSRDGAISTVYRFEALHDALRAAGGR